MYKAKKGFVYFDTLIDKGDIYKKNKQGDYEKQNTFRQLPAVFVENAPDIFDRIAGDGSIIGEPVIDNTAKAINATTTPKMAGGFMSDGTMVDKNGEIIDFTTCKCKPVNHEAMESIIKNKIEVTYNNGEMRIGLIGEYDIANLVSIKNKLQAFFNDLLNQ